MYKDKLLPGETYHIYNRANGSENLFREWENYRYFLAKLVERTAPALKILAYCLMPNHFHILIRVRTAPEIKYYIWDQLLKNGKRALPPGVPIKQWPSFVAQRQLANMMVGYAKAYNKKYDRRGSLLQQNTKRKLIDSEAYLRKACLYIHFNPVHHNFTPAPEYWPHSSYKAYLGNKPTTWLSQTELLHSFGGRAGFRAAHEQHQAAIYQATNAL